MSRDTCHRRTPFLLTLLVVIPPALLVPSHCAAQAVERAEVVFQRAMETEMVQGDLPGAIRLYEELIERFPEQRLLAARALLRIGGCYEKIGDDRAVGAYERVLFSFADLTEYWEVARDRYVALIGAGAAGIDDPLGRQHVLNLPFTAAAPAISPDAAFLVYTDVRTGDLVRLDIGDRRRTRLTGEGGLLPGGSGAVALAARVSPGNGLVVYTLLDAEGGTTIRSVRSDGSGEGSVLYDPGPAVYAEPGVWLQDGSGFYGSVFDRDTGDGSLAFFTRTGQRERLGPVAQGGPPLSMVFVPGLSALYYDPAQDRREVLADIWGLDLADGTAFRVGWSPNSDRLLAADPEEHFLVAWSQAQSPAALYAVSPASAGMTFAPRRLIEFRDHLFPLGVVRDAFYFHSERGLQVRAGDPDWERIPASWIRRWAELRAAEELGHPGMLYGPVDRLGWSGAGALVHASLWEDHQLVFSAVAGAGDGEAAGGTLSGGILLSERHGPSTLSAFSGDGTRLAWLEPPDRVRWFGSGWRLMVRDLGAHALSGWDLPFEPSRDFLVWEGPDRLLLCGRSPEGEEGLYRLEFDSGESHRILDLGWRELFSPVAVDGGVLALERGGADRPGGIVLIEGLAGQEGVTIRRPYRTRDRLLALAVSRDPERIAVAAMDPSGVPAAARSVEIRIVPRASGEPVRVLGRIPTDGSISSFRWRQDDRTLELFAGARDCTDGQTCVEGWQIDAGLPAEDPIRFSIESGWRTAIHSRDGRYRVQTRSDPERRSEIWVMRTLFEFVGARFPDLKDPPR